MRNKQTENFTQSPLTTKKSTTIQTAYPHTSNWYSFYREEKNNADDEHPPSFLLFLLLIIWKSILRVPLMEMQTTKNQQFPKCNHSDIPFVCLYPLFNRSRITQTITRSNRISLNIPNGRREKQNEVPLIRNISSITLPPPISVLTRNPNQTLNTICTKFFFVNPKANCIHLLSKYENLIDLRN